MSLDHPRTPAPRVRWLTPGVRGIGVASFLSDLGHEVPTSLLPRFVTSTLGGSAAALGLIEGLADGAAGVARLAGGALADDPQRRRAVAVGGYASTAVLTSLIGVATGVWQVAVLRTGAWAARGLRVPSRNALLADAVPSDAYGRAYGFERSMDNLGAIGGPLLALALVAAFSVRSAILLSVIPGLLAALSIIYAIRRIPQMRAHERRPVRLRVRPVLQGGLRGLMASVAAFEMGNVAATLLILRATELLAPEKGLTSATETALLLYVAYNVAATLISVPAGHVSDGLGASVVFAGGTAAFLGAFVFFALAGSGVLPLAIGFTLAGIGIGCAETAQSTAVAALAPANLRGSAFGLLAAIQAFGNLIASAVAGLIWTLAAPAAAFWYLAAWMVICLGLLVADRGFLRRAGADRSGGPAE